MQENKFEKQVREEMEEFRIRPSATVWESVEEELRRKKRRRVVVYWFLLAAIGLGAYGVYHLLAPALPEPSTPISLQKKQSTDQAASSADQHTPNRQISTGLPANGSGAGNKPTDNIVSSTTKNNIGIAVNSNDRKFSVQEADRAQLETTSRKTGKNKSETHKQAIAGNASGRQLSGKPISTPVNKNESAKTNTRTLNISSPVALNPVENKETGKLAQTEAAAEESQTDATASIADHDLVKDSSTVSNNHQDLPENPRTPITVSRRRIQWRIAFSFCSRKTDGCKQSSCLRCCQWWHSGPTPFTPTVGVKSFGRFQSRCAGEYTCWPENKSAGRPALFLQE